MDSKDAFESASERHESTYSFLFCGSVTLRSGARGRHAYACFSASVPCASTYARMRNCE